MTPPRVLGRARLRSEHVRHAVALTPGEWYTVITPAADIQTPPLDGYVWIDLDGRPRHVWAAHLEIDLEDGDGE